jgi:hypothetical protein
MAGSVVVLLDFAFEPAVETVVVASIYFCFIKENYMQATSLARISVR